MEYKELSRQEMELYVSIPLPKGSQIFVVEDNPEFNVKQGWSDRDFFGNQMSNNFLDNQTILNCKIRIPA